RAKATPMLPPPMTATFWVAGVCCSDILTTNTQASAGVDRLSGNERGVLMEEERSEVCDIFRGADASHGDPLDDRLGPWAVRRIRFDEQGGGDGARGDGVGGNAVAAQLQCPDPGESDEAGLRRRVRRPQLLAQGRAGG